MDLMATDTWQPKYWLPINGNRSMASNWWQPVRDKKLVEWKEGETNNGNQSNGSTCDDKKQSHNRRHLGKQTLRNTNVVLNPKEKRPVIHISENIVLNTWQYPRPCRGHGPRAVGAIALAMVIDSTMISPRSRL